MAKLLSAHGYRGDSMHLPVASVEVALPFYEQVLGFSTQAREDAPGRVVFERDAVRIGLAENGGDPTQDGCAFHVEGVDELLQEFISRGLKSDPSRIELDIKDDGSRFRVFFVVAPDGLCYWFGERQN